MDRLVTMHNTTDRRTDDIMVMPIADHTACSTLC